MVRIFQGHHSSELVELLKTSFQKNDLVIVCSPLIQDFRFVEQLSDEALAKFPDRPVLGVFTTGTVSGNPRLVLYSKKNVLSSLDSVFSLFDDSKIEEVFCYPQPFHTFGLTLGYLYAILREKKLSFVDGPYTQAAHTARASIQHEKVLTLGTPAHFFDLISQVEAGKIKLHPSYSAILGGAKVSTSLWHDIQNKLHINAPSIGYGASEACPGVTHLPPGIAPLEEGEIGFPLPNVAVELKDGIGLEFSGDNLCVAILENGEIHFPKKVLLTDLIEKRANDRLVYVGRTSQIINRGGAKYAIEAIEAMLVQNLNRRVAVISVPDERLGEDIGILVEISESGADTPSLDSLKESCKKILNSKFAHQFALPVFKVVKHLPFNDNGKLDRKMLKTLVEKNLQ